MSPDINTLINYLSFTRWFCVDLSSSLLYLLFQWVPMSTHPSIAWVSLGLFLLSFLVPYCECYIDESRYQQTHQLLEFHSLVESTYLLFSLPIVIAMLMSPDINTLIHYLSFFCWLIILMYLSSSPLWLLCWWVLISTHSSTTWVSLVGYSSPSQWRRFLTSDGNTQNMQWPLT